MNPAYTLFHKKAEVNKQLYTLLRFAVNCDNVSAFVKTDDAAITFLTAQNKKINICNYEDGDTSKYNDAVSIAKELDINLNIFKELDSSIDASVELLYIDTVAEGNLKAMELAKFGANVKKYIILNKTSKFAHNPEQDTRLPIDKKIGVVFGINHFLQTNDDWFILHHDDVDPGMTVLVNRKNVNAY